MWALFGPMEYIKIRWGNLGGLKKLLVWWGTTFDILLSFGFIPSFLIFLVDSQ